MASAPGCSITDITVDTLPEQRRSYPDDAQHEQAAQQKRRRAHTCTVNLKKPEPARPSMTLMAMPPGGEQLTRRMRVSMRPVTIGDSCRGASK